MQDNIKIKLITVIHYNSILLNALNENENDLDKNKKEVVLKYSKLINTIAHTCCIGIDCKVKNITEDEIINISKKTINIVNSESISKKDKEEVFTILDYLTKMAAS